MGFLHLSPAPSWRCCSAIEQGPALARPAASQVDTTAQTTQLGGQSSSLPLLQMTRPAALVKFLGFESPFAHLQNGEGAGKWERGGRVEEGGREGMGKHPHRGQRGRMEGEGEGRAERKRHRPEALSRSWQGDHQESMLRWR